ncbi:hypothetical protein P154DRAFT_559785 [Amniculicola lignicola CBS 123094]|uniref:Uncharacterized protein n=1 Tax=Amniculicola lignicola CBS 123094 TaxID=1392246 RepID=A0A6A5WXB3_9PLEO|nr:hypothetical protein P154DRAFT_559785 [Amniculicola lignicola CBS 123094]
MSPPAERFEFKDGCDQQRQCDHSVGAVGHEVRGEGRRHSSLGALHLGVRCNTLLWALLQRRRVSVWVPSRIPSTKVARCGLTPAVPVRTLRLAAQQKRLPLDGAIQIACRSGAAAFSLLQRPQRCRPDSTTASVCGRHRSAAAVNTLQAMGGAIAETSRLRGRAVREGSKGGLQARPIAAPGGHGPAAGARPVREPESGVMRKMQARARGWPPSPATTPAVPIKLASSISSSSPGFRAHKRPSSSPGGDPAAHGGPAVVLAALSRRTSVAVGHVSRVGGDHTGEQEAVVADRPFRRPLTAPPLIPRLGPRGP